MTFLYAILALLLLGFMILVHEAGHFLASRLMMIPVKEFSIGFGPKLFSWKSKKYDTVFSVRLIIAGGYCMYYGEDDPNAEKKYSDNDPRLLKNQNVWKRMLVIVMGPFMNILLALVVSIAFISFSSVICAYDYGTSVPIIQMTVTGSAAEEAGVMVGDTITSINGIPLQQETDNFRTAVYAKANGYDIVLTNEENVLMNASAMMNGSVDEYVKSGEPVTLTLSRDGNCSEVNVFPKFSADDNSYMLGISYSLTEPEVVCKEKTIGSVLSCAFNYAYEVGGSIIRGFGTLFSSWNNLTTMGSGPVGIVKAITEETAEYGMTAYIDLLIIISINLGMVNLLPIPGLDGSRIVFLLIEALRGKPVSSKVEAYIHLSGFAVLLGLMIILTYHDILRILGFQ